MTNAPMRPLYSVLCVAILASASVSGCIQVGGGAPDDDYDEMHSPSPAPEAEQSPSSQPMRDDEPGPEDSPREWGPGSEGEQSPSPEPRPEPPHEPEPRQQPGPCDGPAPQHLDRLAQGEVLRSGEVLVSANGQFHVAMQDDGNLVHYFDMHGAHRSHWASETHGNGASCMRFDDDGHLIVLTHDGRVTWSSRGEGGAPGVQFIVQDDANIVLYRNPGPAPYDGPDSVGWAHNRPLDWIAPGQRLLPGWFMTSHNWQCKLIMQHDGNLVLYTSDDEVRWASDTDGNPNAHMIFQDDGNAVVYDANGHAPWATGTDRRASDFFRLSGDCTAFVTEGDAILWQGPWVGHVPPGVRGDDYPYRNADPNAADPWAFFYRQCTSFVAWRINNTNGIPFHNWMGEGGRFGHANTWDDRARALGYRVDNNPAPGAIAQTDAGSHGHVAWVAEVRGNTVVIEEYNRRRLAYSAVERPIGEFRYIHIDSPR